MSRSPRVTPARRRSRRSSSPTAPRCCGPHVDSYSAFLEADRKTPTGLTGYLRERGLKQVFLVGLATDFCVAWSALDARKAGFAASVIEDATRGIDAGGSLGKAWADMTGAGVKRIQSADIRV